MSTDDNAADRACCRPYIAATIATTTKVPFVSRVTQHKGPCMA